MKHNNIKIIAEIGWNHMGNMKLAEKMIKSSSTKKTVNKNIKFIKV